MARRRRRQHLGDGILHHFLDRIALVEKTGHERRVRAVLEQAPHEIGEQVFVDTDRRVGA